MDNKEFLTKEDLKEFFREEVSMEISVAKEYDPYTPYSNHNGWISKLTVTLHSDSKELLSASVRIADIKDEIDDLVDED